MGIVHPGVPTELVLQLKQEFPISTFVETGTYAGGTSVWAASQFEQVITIENSRKLYDQTVAKHGHIPNINFLFGNSKDLLKEVIPTLKSPALFWLDGHWSGGDTYGEEEQCPILEEIATINSSSSDHFLLIDDARLYTSPPPRPCRIDQWPPIDQVIESIKAGPHEKYFVIFEDVLIAVPKHVQTQVADWLHETNSQAWAKQMQERYAGRFQRGIGLIGQGLDLLGQSALGRLRQEG